MAKLPESIQKLIEEFNKLPGIGPKTSERFVFYLLKQSKEELEKFAKALSQLKGKIKICQTCYNFSEKDSCEVCRDKKRDSKTICIVAESSDLEAIEKTGEYNGVYHVLGGVINQIEGVGPEKLKIKVLKDRIKKDGIEEIIIATNPDIEGESTAMYLARFLNPLKIKITRIARGLPMGSDLEYADEITLANALKGRKEI